MNAHDWNPPAVMPIAPSIGAVTAGAVSSSTSFGVTTEVEGLAPALATPFHPQHRTRPLAATAHFVEPAPLMAITR